MMFKTHRNFTGIVIASVVAGLVVSSLAQSSNKSESSFRISPSSYDWVNEEWTGNEKPFRRIRADIDKDITQGQLTSRAIEIYFVRWQKNQKNPQILFRWAYASYQADQTHPPIRQQQVPADSAFDLAPSPHAYEYARLRFLIKARNMYHSELQHIGQHLLKRDPNDYDVEYYLIKCFKPWVSTREKQQSLFYAQDLIAKNPKKPSAYAALGDIYNALWFANRSKPDAEKAIMAYRAYLRLAPPNYVGRSNVEQAIRYIENAPIH